MSSSPIKNPDPSLPSSSSPPLRQFSLSEIKYATKNFDEALLIRRCGLTEVYKGTYYDYDGKQKIVAIKSFNFELSKLQNLQVAYNWFKMKLDVWPQYGHKHVVSVIGYCQEPPSTYITVYEYMPNGSLANHLRTRTTPTSFNLSWEQCLQICIDAARGLEYLHSQVKYPDGDRFNHCDVTANNILLDSNGVAKISDLYIVPFARQYNAACQFDPLYQSTRHINPYVDVYAFGVILVKVLCRKVSINLDAEETGIWFKECIMNGAIYGFISLEMKAQVSPDCLKSFLDVAGECLNDEPLERPSFTQVVKKLELSMASSLSSSSSSSSSSQRLCHRYSLHEIDYVTNNFESILGQGGEGTVYEGVTKTNITVAVKRLKPGYSSEFQKEIQMLSNLEHPNLVSLVGFCHESDEHILIYEFVCNGNLAQNLYGRGARSLSWKQRLNICIGAARGLRYLHTRTNSSRKGIIHRDVKPVNILLDENFNAKISDFGLSKMGPKDQSKSEIATMVKGTTGYYAPEYQRYGQITRRIDVYAFGVVLSEVLCGKKPWDREESFYPSENEQFGLWAKENIVPDLKGVIAPVCLEAFTGILEKCLNWNPNRRPSMNDVVFMLEYGLKWQEAWEGNKSGGGLDLPGSEDRVVLYYSSTSQEVATTIKIRLLLWRFTLQFDERDITKDLYLNEFRHVFGNTADLHMPQLFVHGKYVGDANEAEKLYKTGELAKFFGVTPPKFIWDSCREAKPCSVCDDTVWFIHCKNCDALTQVQRKLEGKLRSCLECDGSMMICSSVKDTLQG